MNFKSIRIASLLGLTLLALTGCVSLDPQGITPTLTGQGRPGSPYYQAVCVVPGGTFAHTMFEGTTIKVSAKTMTTVLRQTLANNNLLAADTACRYYLSATVTHIGRNIIDFGGPIHAYSTVVYNLASAPDHTTLLNRSINIDYVLPVGPIPPGSTDLTTDLGAAEAATQTAAFYGAVKMNIQTFVQSLQ